MKKGQIYEGVVERIDFPNKGVIWLEDREILVKNVLPGQRIKFSVQKVRKGKGEGRVLEILENAPEEIQASCEHFRKCGGCLYQTLSYDRQLEIKSEQVKALLDRVCKNYLFEGIKRSPKQFEYRNKMEFSFGDEVKDGQLELGMHKRNSFHDIVSVTGCQIVDEDFRKILNCVLKYFREKETSFYHKRSHIGYLRYLLVRKAAKTGEILIDLVTTTQEPDQDTGWTDQVLKLDLKGQIAGILHTYDDCVADALKDQGTKILYGKDFFYEELLGLRFKISPFSFFQTNSYGAEVLYKTAREYVGDTKNKVIFDLYSGTGTIAQILAPVAKKVVGVEIIEEAVEAARKNAEINHLTNCEFIAGDVLKVLDELADKPDLIVLDPPRDGIHPKAILKIINFQVKHIVYISCKPTSLARDLEIFQNAGYLVEKVCCVDMFAGTNHVEVVIQMTFCGRKEK